MFINEVLIELFSELGSVCLLEHRVSAHGKTQFLVEVRVQNRVSGKYSITVLERVIDYLMISC